MATDIMATSTTKLTHSILLTRFIPRRSCESGKYQERKMQKNCVGCEIGKYGDGLSGAFSSTHCGDCPPGTASNIVAAPAFSSCANCPGGRFSKVGNSTCTVCEGGKYSPAGSPSCSPCLAGTFSLSETSSCTNCLGGKFAASDLSTSCQDCLKGTYR